MSEHNFQVIQKQFFCATPVTKINWESILKNIEWDEQNELIQQTICHELNVKFPVKLNYQILFLKYVIKELELNSQEIHDILYEKLAEKMKESSPEEFCFKSYILPENEVVSIKEAVSFIKDGTTGLCIWQASFAMCEYLIKHKDFFNGKTILELGSGIGLVGSVITKVCQPKQLFLSDCHSKVLNILTENIELNIPEDVKSLDPSILIHKHYKFKEIELGILNLPWEDAENNKEMMKEVCLPDLVIGADLVYDDSLFDNLVSCLNVIFEITQNKCKALFFCTIRNKETFNIFTMKLVINKYQIEDLGEFTPEIFSWDDNLPKTILVKIYKNQDIHDLTSDLPKLTLS